MKKIVFLLVFIMFIVMGCKKENYNDYIGYQFSGQDPWNGKITITLRTLIDGKLSWTYVDSYNEDNKLITLYNELTTNFIEGTSSFNAKGNTDSELYTFDYTGSLRLKDNKLIITYEKGELTFKNKERNLLSHMIDDLKDNERIVTLTKVENNK